MTQNTGSMADQTADELSYIIASLRNQLQFLDEIGISDIGGLAGGSEVSRIHASAISEPGRVRPEGNPDSIAVNHAPPDSAPVSGDGLPLATPPEVTTTPTDSKARQEKGSQMPRPKQPDSEMTTLPQLDLFGEAAARPSPVPGVRSLAASTTLFDRLPKDAALEDIRADIGDCTRCRLSKQRNHIVFGEGNPKADLVFVGEGPGADEDATGRPFVGRAGQLLDKIIEAMGFKRSDVYICNVVKCRPPENRTPERDEVDICQDFLFRQLAVIRPKVIVALGAPALQCLAGSRESITRARGQWRDWNGIKLLPTYHPAYLLRSPDKKKETWEDVKRVRDYLAGVALP